ncbi:MAG: FprA family A-type flavoprotein [Bacteroidaceae bacterium]|nr:FprA family A-type flavoprotein [Bacteroidaceae bacterium]
MAKLNVALDIYHIGANDTDLDFFEGQYIVPEGMSYNSYVIDDGQIAILDTIDERKTEEWIQKLDEVLDGRKPDYLIVQHLEPDHSANIKYIVERFPECKLVCSAKCASMIPQFFDIDLKGSVQTVKEGDTLAVGSHTLQFVLAPMVHWPEVMVTYDQTAKVLFAADAFGKFGYYDEGLDDWDCEARRYYFNIVGKYGVQVQNLLKKAAKLDIQTILPLHGPFLTGDLTHYIKQYDTWSKYEPETDGFFIAYCSLHGNTAQAAQQLADILAKKTDKKISIADLVRTDMAEDIEDAFRYSNIVLAAPTYDAGVMPVMADFLAHLKAKNYQNRRVAIIENGSWAPMAAKRITEELQQMKNITIIDKVVSIRSTVKPETITALEELADELVK